MNRQYYYLVAGLPDLFFDDKKLSVSTLEFRNFLSEHLPPEDMNLIKMNFWKYDNQNILNRLNNPDSKVDVRGNLTSDEIDEVFASQRNDSMDSLDFNIPEYLTEFIDAFKADTPIYPGKSWSIQLSELYYNYVSEIKNSFIKNWFIYERDLNNILTAVNCRENEISIEKQLVGDSELIDKLCKSSARDFGLSDEIAEVDKVFKAVEEQDLLEQEKKIDLLKWNLIEDDSFFHYFTIEKLFAFLIKLSIAERWISLDKDTGLQLFEELLKSLEASYEFPGEFSLN